MRKEIISVIIPVYNVERELDRCIKSILNQTYKNIEVIIVDDGSTDNCPRLCDKYGDIDDRVKVIHQENKGLASARNTGLKEATGDYILYVDSDDYIEKEACEKLSQLISDDVDIICGAYTEVRSNKVKVFRHSNIKEGKIYSSREFVISSIKNNEWYAVAWLNLYNKSFLINNNLYYKDGYLFEDMQILPKMFLCAKKVVYLDYPFYNYIIRENSIMTSVNSKQKISISLDIYREWFELFKQVEDKEYQKYLYGILVRYYLKNSRNRKIRGWNIDGFDFTFALKHAIGIKEKLKVIIYTIFPILYLK